MSAFVVREFKEADVAGIARLSAQLGYPATEAQIFERASQITNDPTHLNLVAAADALGIVGWASAHESRSMLHDPSVELIALAVDATHRGGGIGGALVRAVEVWAKQRNCARIIVRANVARNDAHAFYAALGYVRPKSQHVFVREL